PTTKNVTKRQTWGISRMKKKRRGFEGPRLLLRRNRPCDDSADRQKRKPQNLNPKKSALKSQPAAKNSTPGYLQGMIEPQLEDGALIETKIAVGQDPGKRARRGADTGANRGSFAPTRCSTASRAEPRAHGCGFNRAPLAH